VHAELRLAPQGPVVIEVAARSIGGLCSRTLRFGTGVSLEELILRHALGADTSAFERERQPSGVMMLPIPRRGILRAVRGREDAEQVVGVEGIELTIPIGQEVVPLPEGANYLGFIFARGETPAAVEESLRLAQRRLEFDIEPSDEAHRA